MMVKKNVLASAFAGVGFAASASAGTLLVDFGGNDNGGILASAASDFQGQDADVDLAAPVNVFNGDVNIASSGNIVPVTGIDSAGTSFTADVQVLDGSGFNANTGANSGTSNVPILDGYLTLSFGDGVRFAVTGLEEIAAGTEVTLTVYAVGDQANQVGGVGVTLGEATEAFITADGALEEDRALATNTSNAGTVSGDAGATPVIGADSFRQTTFTKVDGVDSFEIRIDRASQFSAVNGFSLTFDTLVPEPASFGLVGLGALAICGRRRRA